MVGFEMVVTGFFYRARKDLDLEEFMFFLTGGIGLENKRKNPAPAWLLDKSWDEICRLSSLKHYKKFRWALFVL